MCRVYGRLNAPRVTVQFTCHRMVFSALKPAVVLNFRSNSNTVYMYIYRPKERDDTLFGMNSHANNNIAKSKIILKKFRHVIKLKITSYGDKNCVFRVLRS